MEVVSICQEIGWTYYEYMSQPNWFLELLKITDYTLMLNPSEEKDEMADEQLQFQKITNARLMQQMGYEVTLNEDEEFEFEPTEVPVTAPEGMGGGMEGLGSLGGLGGQPKSPGAQLASPASLAGSQGAGGFGGSPSKIGMGKGIKKKK